MSDLITVLVSGTQYDELAAEASVLKSPGYQSSDISLDTKRISDELSKILLCIQEVSTLKNMDYEISEVQLKFGVNAKGKFGIWCIGGEAGADAAIQVTIKHHKK